MGRWGDGEMGRWGDGEMGRWGDGEMGRWGKERERIFTSDRKWKKAPSAAKAGGDIFAEILARKKLSGGGDDDDGRITPLPSLFPLSLFSLPPLYLSSPRSLSPPGLILALASSPAPAASKLPDAPMATNAPPPPMMKKMPPLPPPGPPANAGPPPPPPPGTSPFLYLSSLFLIFPHTGAPVPPPPPYAGLNAPPTPPAPSMYRDFFLFLPPSASPSSSLPPPLPFLSPSASSLPLSLPSFFLLYCTFF
jgi:hypothetical protein